VAGITRLRAALFVLPALLSAMAVMRTSDAAFTDTATSMGNVFSATSLAAPSGTAASYRCVLTVRSIAVTWTASPSAATTTYRISRSVNGGAYGSVATVASGTSSWTDTSVSGSTTYVYRVRAERSGTSWISAESSPTSAVSTPLLCV
jgi:hypothetical protein